jgi:class 3 adenylate cyclase
MEWGKEYYQVLCDKFESVTDKLNNRISAISDGTNNPTLEELTIGSAKKYRASVIFYDICSFSKRTNSSNKVDLDKALITLDVLLPMLIKIVFDYGGYVEKNTGDGIMAILGVGEDDYRIASYSLDAMTTMNYVVENLVNPFLIERDIDPIDGRLSADLGDIYISRIGTSKGRSEHEHSFLTVVGPPANIASHINDLAGENQILVGDLIKTQITDYRKEFFEDVSPSNWTWHYSGNTSKTYSIWHYKAVRKDPNSM